MEVRQAQQFLAVVEHGGIARAAPALHLAQPSLSQAIRTLEHEMGAPLFHRVGRGLVLTTAGEALINPARQLLRDVATARASVAEVAGVLSGSLDISLMGGPLEHLIPTVAAFRRRHSEVLVRLDVPNLERTLLNHVRQGRSELGFTPLTPDTEDGTTALPGLNVLPLGSDELMLALPPGTDPALPDPLPVDRLPAIPTIAIPRDADTRKAVEQIFRAVGMRTKLALVTAYRSTQIPLVLRGAGMAFVLGNQAEWARAQGAVVRHLSPTTSIAYGAVTRSGYLSPGANAFLNLAISRLSASPATTPCSHSHPTRSSALR
ncbi:LysR family transcriptional regulator [Saccharopolyspora shandongensis]|uniref:LysR family transcriptional regulator n=1 Tax=Saccharopolyspora shandongensis TaxID=418495 RepID=UPI003419E04F